MELKFNIQEFQKFRWAHARSNNVLFGVYILFAMIIGAIRWLFDIEVHLWSQESAITIGVCAAIALSVPRAGYKLARHIVGVWYKLEFGANYSEYRKNEKLVVERINSTRRLG